MLRLQVLPKRLARLGFQLRLRLALGAEQEDRTLHGADSNRLAVNFCRARCKMTLCERVFIVNEWWGQEDRCREVVTIDPSPGFMIDFGPWWDNWKPF